jgi:hypothetical protein
VIERACRNDRKAEIRCDAWKRAAANRAKYGSKAIGLGDLETADEFFTFKPFKAIRTENNIACMAGAAGLAAALAVTMIKGSCAAFKLVAYGAAQATARER